MWHLRAHSAGYQARGGRGLTVMAEERSHADRVVSASVHEQTHSVSRRRFVGLAAGTAFIFGFYVPTRRSSQAAERASFAPNAFIRIDRQGDVTLIMPQVEMG